MKRIISAITNFLVDAAYNTLSVLIYVAELAKTILVLLATIVLAIFAIRLGKNQAKNAYNSAKRTVFGVPTAQPNASKPPQAGTLTPTIMPKEDRDMDFKDQLDTRASRYGAPKTTRDGVTVVKEGESNKVIAQMIKEASSKTNNMAGDGTTTKLPRPLPPSVNNCNAYGSIEAATQHETLVIGGLSK